MDNFTMSKKDSCKGLKKQTKPWKHKCYRYLLDLTFCTMSYKITNKKFIWFQRYKEITRRLSPKWNQKNVLLLCDTLFIYRKRVSCFSFYTNASQTSQTLQRPHSNSFNSHAYKASLLQVFPFKSQGVFPCLI